MNLNIVTNADFITKQDENNLFLISDVEDDELSSLDEGDDEYFEEEKKDEFVFERSPVKLCPKLAWMKEKKECCDLVFIVGNGHNTRRFSCHRIILASCSPIFASLVFPNHLLASSDINTNVLELQLKDVSPDIFELFLDCIYTDNVKLSSESVTPLFELGEKYQVDKIQLACSEFRKSDPVKDNALLMFEIGPALGKPDLGLSFIRKNFSELLSGDGILKLSKNRLYELFTDDELEVDEMILFDCLIRWGKKNIKKTAKGDKINLRKSLGKLVQTIRFPLLTHEQLTAHVVPTNILTPKELSICYRYALTTQDEIKLNLKMPFSTEERSGSCGWDDSILLCFKDRKNICKLFNGKAITLKLVYRGSRDGFNASSFHRCSNNAGPTITFILSQKKKYLFGGFFAGSWAGNNYSLEKSFLFSLKNASGKLLKLLPTNSGNHVKRSASYGPTWGGGHDLYVAGNMRSNQNYSNPHTFKKIADGFEFKGTFTNSTLAGSYNFSVDEIEVFSVKRKSVGRMGCQWDESKILKNEDKVNICKILDRTDLVEMKLLYRGSRDGFNGSTFHSRSNNKGPTITFIRPQGNDYLFGGFFQGNWSGSGYTSEKSFIFSLRNGLGRLQKFIPSTTSTNVYRNASYGPTWGGGHDLHINNSMRSRSNYTNPHTFKKAAKGFTGTYTQTLMAGSYKFIVDEIEVFSVNDDFW